MQKELSQQTFLVFQDVFKTSWRRLQRNTFRLPKRLQDVFKTYLRYVFLKLLQDVFKTPSKTSSRRVCKKSCNYVFKTSRQKNVTLKTSSVRLHQDECFAGVPLKYQSKFWRSLEISLINCKIHLELNWSKNRVMSYNAGNTKYKITNTKLYVSIVTLSTKDNVKLTK